MKYKLISLAAAAFIFVFMAVLSYPYDLHNREIQHMTAADKPDCELQNGSLCTALPIVSIDMGGQQPTITLVEVGDKITHLSSEVAGSLTVFDSAAQNNHTSDAPVFSTKLIARYRGNSSMLFDKKSYRLSFVGEDGVTENKQTFIGMPAHEEWVLNGPFLDKTLMRNYLCMNIAGQIRNDTPQVRFCELVVNGRYQGVYLAMEHIAVGEDRVDLTKYNEGEPYTSYMLRVDRSIEPERDLNSFSEYAMRLSASSQVEIIYPPVRLLTPELTRYVKNDFSVFEKTLYSYDYTSEAYGYPALTDVGSFVDYFIINEFFYNLDAGRYSTYFYKDLRGKINIGPVWDFNNSCDNYMETVSPTNGFSMVDRTWFNMMTRDPDFVNRVIERYRHLRKTVLSEQYLMSFIDDTQAYLGDAIDRNYSVWGYSFDANRVNDDNKLIPDSRNPDDYSAAVQQLRDYLCERGDWMDDNIELLKQYCHYSYNKKYNH